MPGAPKKRAFEESKALLPGNPMKFLINIKIKEKFPAVSLIK
jgi:hypothetical protein